MTTKEGQRKLTPKQERFCTAYIETGNASEAYRQAYDAENMKPTTVNRKAHELLDNGKITARIEELQVDHQERHKVTVDNLTLELEEARTVAIGKGQPSAMVSATLGKAKLHGLGTEKLAVTGKDGKPLFPDITVTYVLPDGKTEDYYTKLDEADRKRLENER